MKATYVLLTLRHATRPLSQQTMLGTVTELYDVYVSDVSGYPTVTWASSVGPVRMDICDFLSHYGATADAVDSQKAKLLKLRGVHQGLPTLSVYATREIVDASDFPPVHPTWRQQQIDVADEGDVAFGRFVYLALRMGLLAKVNPLPDGIAVVVVAASSECIRHGRWTSRASLAKRKRRPNIIHRYFHLEFDDDDGAWNDDKRVYVLLPRSCVLAPGATGEITGRAFGVGWARDGKLENYTDILSGRVEVLGSHVTVAPSGLVATLSTATLFLVDIGRRLSLPGWSGVLSVIAQYRADDAYSSRVANRAVMGMRNGHANFASIRDLTASTVITIWYPLLALGAETIAPNAAWVSYLLCAVIVLMLVYAHGLKLQNYGISGSSQMQKQLLIFAQVLLAPLLYRLCFYWTFTGLCGWVYVRLATGSFQGKLELNKTKRIFFIVFSLGSVVEALVIGTRYGWDPASSTATIRWRWIAAGVMSAGLQTYYMVGDNRAIKRIDPTPYKLSGWSHIDGGATYASRYVVEYGCEERGICTIWRG